MSINSKKTNKLRAVFCLIVTIILAVFLGLFSLYLTFFPVGVVDRLLGSSPSFFSSLEWQPWTPVDQWQGELTPLEDGYIAFRKGTYTTCFYNFEIVQGKQASDPQIADYLPRFTITRARKDRIYTVIIVTIFLICVSTFYFFFIAKTL